MIYYVIIPLLLTFVPWLVVRYIFTTNKSSGITYAASAPYLLLAAGLWVAAMFVPNIPISAETDSFSMHAFGGIVAGVLALYVMRAYDIRFTQWWQPLVAFYLFVSGLGVGNELLEFALTETGIMIIDNSDVWWDLLANSLGAFTVCAGWYIIKWLSNLQRRT